MTERELIELLNEMKILLDLDEIDMAKDRIDTIIQSYSQPNGGDRVVNENEPQKEVCAECGSDRVTEFRDGYECCSCENWWKQND